MKYCPKNSEPEIQLRPSKPLQFGRSEQFNRSMLESTSILLQQALYRLFAWLFLYLDKERLNTLHQGAVELLENHTLWESETYATSLRSLLEQLTSMDNFSKEAMARDNSRLFTIRPMVPPYESLYTTPSTESRGWVSAQLERLYARYGLVLSEMNEMPDHLAVELEFMSYLCELEAGAQQVEDRQSAEAYQQAQADFLDRHLRKWLGKFCLKVRAASPDGFYADTVDALAAYIR